MKCNCEVSFAILALSQLKRIGAIFIKKNLSSIRQKHRWFYSTTEKSIENLLTLVKKKYSLSEIQEAISKAEEILAECESNQIGFMSIIDENYPKKLLEIKDSPPVLFFRGNLSLLTVDAVTIIGTRKPNDNGKRIAERVGKHFASKGWVICNGLADGIDTFSILEQEKFCFAKVIGVVGSGLSSSAFRSLPKQSIANIDYVLEKEGLILSEMPPLKKQDTFSVVKSCRIQAGIGKGIILIQSPLDGGSKFTVKAAVDSKRPLGVIRPVKSDINREDYAANIRIIEGGVKGLGEFVELKNCSNPKIFVLSSKESYPEFELELEHSNQVLKLNI
ncbi:DNA-processing protein DprA [Calothrix sp. UHCC 0171]|uniref:DNA-processing protein DprA n=1 Tax=Calothrix sp. UHCC 0171 TaxID=3110245 RepID=UPI002B1E92CA|nr:DNA-processing protein DprA [Calothrix sp. UHCC 0171]MEA5574733.1 DNA-processing protein DprA [Calothrix sp. UHCC 0171]